MNPSRVRVSKITSEGKGIKKVGRMHNLYALAKELQKLIAWMVF
jgi:hypothetical protein